MSTLNEVKEQMSVVASVGDFTNALQQIATLHMIKLREQVISSRPFVEAANEMLKELHTLRATMLTEDLMKLEKKYQKEKDKLSSTKRAVVVITSNQGLTGRYNPEIYQKVEKLLEQPEEKEADFYVIGKKGQEVFQNGKFKVKNFPYAVPENFTSADLLRMANVFEYYSHVTLIYSRFINTATREVVALTVVTPVPETDPDAPASKGKYIYEPDIDRLIEGVSRHLRAALFQQQIMDARLAQNSAQMIGMKTASDNATHLLADLKVDYNKQRRKMIDKKIGEVFAGSALW